MLPKTTVLQSFVTSDCSLLSFVICGSPIQGDLILLKTTVLESFVTLECCLHIHFASTIDTILVRISSIAIALAGRVSASLARCRLCACAAGAMSRPVSRAARQRSRTGDLPHGVELLPAEGGEVANQTGRIGLYCFNFGEVRHSGETAAQLENLKTAPGVVLAGQECLNGVVEGLGTDWLHSDLQFVGAGRAAGGDGVVVCGCSSMVARIGTHAEWSGSRGGVSERSSQVFATLRFKFGLAGLSSLTCTSLHAHRGVAKRGSRSPLWTDYLRQLGDAIRASGARVVAGDLNMGLFALADGLRDVCRLDVVLVSHHREVTVTDRVDLNSVVGRAAAMRFDTLGVQ